MILSPLAFVDLENFSDASLVEFASLCVVGREKVKQYTGCLCARIGRVRESQLRLELQPAFYKIDIALVTIEPCSL